MSYYEVRAARTQDDVIDGQCEVVDIYDFSKDAKARAQYLLTDEYQRAGEMSQPLGYAQVLRNGEECVADYFRRAK